MLYSSRENVFTTEVYGPPHMHLVCSPWHLLFISWAFPVGVWVQIYLQSSLLTLVCLRSSFRLLLLAFSRWRFCLSRKFKSVSISGLNGSKLYLDSLLVEFSDDFCVGLSELNFKQTTPKLSCISACGPGLTRTEIVSKNRVTSVAVESIAWLIFGQFFPSILLQVIFRCAMCGILSCMWLRILLLILPFPVSFYFEQGSFQFIY